MRWTRQRRARWMIAGRFAVSDLRAPDERRLSPAKPFGEDGWLRTAKPCGSGTRCWCQVGGGALARPGLTKPQSADDGDKTNSSPGRARNKPLKPLRRECRVFRGTCGDDARVVIFFPREAAGAVGARHSPRPLFRANGSCTTRAHRAARMRMCVLSSLPLFLVALWIASLRSQ